jgi:hypothetical protein
MAAVCLFLRIVGSWHFKIWATEQRANMKCCALLRQWPSDTVECLKKRMGRQQWRKRRFTIGINVFVMAVRVWITFRAARTVNFDKWRKHRACDNGLRNNRRKSVQEISAEIWVSVIRSHSVLCNNLNKHCFCQHLVPKMLNPEHIDRNTNCSCWRPNHYDSSSCWFLSNLMTVSTTVKCSERITIRERRDSLCKSNESTDRGIENRFPRMPPKALRTLAKACHCPRELVWRKCCVNTCKILYNKSILVTFWIYLNTEASYLWFQVTNPVGRQILFASSCSFQLVDVVK